MSKLTKTAHVRIQNELKYLLGLLMCVCVVGSDDSADSDFEQSRSGSSDASALSEAVSEDDDEEKSNKRKTR